MSFGLHSMLTALSLLTGAAVLTVLTMLPVLLMSGGTSDAAPEQPIRFNHKVHLKKEPCSTCHRFYKSREVAGRPLLAICMDCHTNPVTKSLEEEKLRQLSSAKSKLAWQRVTRMPRHVRFSHQRHVVAGKVDCQVCHGAIHELTEPPARPLIQINMEFCINCHRARRVWLPDEVFHSLGKEASDPELLAGLESMRNRRFLSTEQLLAVLEEVSKHPLAPPEKEILVGQIQQAPLVSIDCIACHR